LIKKFSIAFVAVALASATLTACGGNSATNINVAIFLYDVSGSGDQSGFTPGDRRNQLKEKFSNAFDQRNAVYFDFVRRDFGAQQISALITPTFFVTVDEILNKEIHDGGLLKDVRANLTEVWGNMITNETVADSDNCSETIKSKMQEASLGNFTPAASRQLAGKFCSTVSQGLRIVNSIPVVAAERSTNEIGSGIQGAIDKAIQKVESEEMRIHRQYPNVNLVPTLILTSDFLEMRPNFFLLDAMEQVQDGGAACELGTKDAGDIEGTVIPFTLESDGFASIRGSRMTAKVRDNMLQYWTCWFEARNITDINLGDRGVDWSTL
jgi:hypothetical protein